MPEEYLGRSVKCPGCQLTFTAGADTGETSSMLPIHREPADPVPFVQPARDDEDMPWTGHRSPGGRGEEYQADLPYLGRRPPGEDRDDSWSRRHRTLRRERAQATIAGPAKALQLTGIVGIVLGVLALLWSIFYGFQDDYWAVVMGISRIFLSVGSICWAGSVLVGALKMKNFEAYRSVKLSCIVALLPCNPAWLAGLPLSIWALRALSQTDVQDVFDEEAGYGTWWH
jgi:hypothetical protein